MRDLFAKWAAPAPGGSEARVTGVTRVTAPLESGTHNRLAEAEAVTRSGTAGVTGVTSELSRTPPVTRVTRGSAVGVTRKSAEGQCGNAGNPRCSRTNDGEGWDAGDWHTYFEERAAVAEYDGGADRATAERWACEACVARWLDLNPPPDDPARCAYSGEPLPENGGDAVAVLRGGGGHNWVRVRYLEAWHARRRAEAVRALKEMGIEPWPTS